MNEKRYRPTADQQRAVLEFAIQHHCIISPDGWSRQLEGYIEHGHCVCSPERKTCPCDEAKQEIKEKGRCLCGLFWSGYQAYWLAKHFEESLNSVAIVADTKPDASAGDQLPRNKEDAPKSPKLKKFEALLNFREGFEEPDPPSNDYIAEAVSLLTGKAGISLGNSRRVTIFKDDEGTICVDITQPLTATKGVKELTREEETHSVNEASEKPHVIENDAEMALLLELNTDGEVQQLLLQRAMSRFPQILTQEEVDRKTLAGQPIWQEWFFNCLLNLETKGHAAYSMRDLRWRITGNGLRRVALAREVERRSNSTGG